MKSAGLRIVLPVLLIVLVAASPLWFAGKAQNDAGRYFPETGHTISEAVQQEYHDITGKGTPELLYGYPISIEIEKLTEKLSYQYFQKGRFVIDNSNPGDSFVYRSPVGQLVYEAYRTEIEQSKAVQVPPNYNACEVYGNQGLRICYAFLTFYKDYGGETQFGDPLTEAFEASSGVIMQYFEFARLEYYPNNPPGFQVKVSDLGRILFAIAGENQIALIPPENNARAQVVTRLNAQAFTAQGSQKSATLPLDVIVTDQSGQPVPGCVILFLVNYPNGEQKSYKMPYETNEQGIATTDFDLHYDELDTASSTVEISLTVTLPNSSGASDLSTVTSTSFYRGY